MEIVTKVLDNGETIYSAVPPKGIKMYPIGYFKTEQEAVEAYNKAMELK